jgi:hypothetical protein
MEIFPSDAYKQAYLDKLKEIGAAEIYVSFSGGGDSGAIDGVTATDKGGYKVSIEGIAMDWPKESQEYDATARTWIKKETVESQLLENVTENIVYNALEKTDLDWYNNDGGQGEFTLTFDEDGELKMNLTVGINFTTVNHYEFDLTEAK